MFRNYLFANLIRNNKIFKSPNLNINKKYLSNIPNEKKTTEQIISKEEIKSIKKIINESIIQIYLINVMATIIILLEVYNINDSMNKAIDYLQIIDLNIYELKNSSKKQLENSKKTN